MGQRCVSYRITENDIAYNIAGMRVSGIKQRVTATNIVTRLNTQVEGDPFTSQHVIDVINNDSTLRWNSLEGQAIGSGLTHEDFE